MMNVFKCFVFVLLVTLVSARPLVASGVHQEDERIREISIQALKEGVSGFPAGHYEFNVVQSSNEIDERLRKTISEHFLKCLLLRWHEMEGEGAEPKESDLVLFRSSADSWSKNTITRNDYGLDENYSFSLTVADMALEFNRDMHFVPSATQTNGSSNMTLQILSREVIHHLNSGWREGGERKTSVTVSRMRKGHDDLVRYAPSGYWTRYLVFTGQLIKSFVSQGDQWTFARGEESNMVIGRFSVPNPGGPWPELPYEMLSPIGGVFEVEVNLESKGLVRFSVIDHSGEEVERLEFGSAISDSGGFMPLKLHHITRFPGCGGEIRSAETYLGVRSEVREIKPGSIMIPPGANVTDFRVSPPVKYTEGVLPVSDDRILDISAEAVRQTTLNPSPKRTDPGRSKLVVDSLSDQSDKPKEVVGRNKGANPTHVGRSMKIGLGIALLVIAMFGIMWGKLRGKN